MKYWTLLLAFYSTGCGIHFAPQFKINGFETYYNTFVANTNVSTNNLIIQMGDLSSGDTQLTELIGECAIGPSPIVTIDPTYWATAAEDDRQELIDHELGHCLLNRVHRNDDLSNGNPASIMDAYHFPAYILDQSPQYYYHELVYGN